MSEAFNSIKQGLTEAIEYSKGKPGKAIVHEFTPVDVKAIRKKLAMSQAELRALSADSEPTSVSSPLKSAA